jgi:hypothetical protein
MKLATAIFRGVALLILSGLSFGAAPDQPHMQSARTNLLQARAALQRAARNKGGHRANAIGYVNSAISEVDMGIQYDRRNNHAEKSGPAGDQPNMEEALDRLKDAKKDLEKATSDKGGHRVKAIEYVNLAMDEVKAGIKAGN